MNIIVAASDNRGRINGQIAELERDIRKKGGDTVKNRRRLHALYAQRNRYNAQRREETRIDRQKEEGRKFFATIRGTPEYHAAEEARRQAELRAHPPRPAGRPIDVMMAKGDPNAYFKHKKAQEDWDKKKEARDRAAFVKQGKRGKAGPKKPPETEIEPGWVGALRNYKPERDPNPNPQDNLERMEMERLNELPKSEIFGINFGRLPTAIVNGFNIFGGTPAQARARVNALQTVLADDFIAPLNYSAATMLPDWGQKKFIADAAAGFITTPLQVAAEAYTVAGPDDDLLTRAGAAANIGFSLAGGKLLGPVGKLFKGTGDDIVRAGGGLAGEIIEMGTKADGIPGRTLMPKAGANVRAGGLSGVVSKVDSVGVHVQHANGRVRTYSVDEVIPARATPTPTAKAGGRKRVANPELDRIRKEYGVPDLSDADAREAIALQKRARAGKLDTQAKALSDDVAKKPRPLSREMGAGLAERAKQIADEVERLDGNGAVRDSVRRKTREGLVAELDGIVKAGEIGGDDWLKKSLAAQAKRTKSYKPEGLLARARTTAGRLLTESEAVTLKGQAESLAKLERTLKRPLPEKQLAEVRFQRDRLKATIDGTLDVLKRAPVDRGLAAGKAANRVKSGFNLGVASPKMLLHFVRHPVVTVQSLKKGLAAMGDKGAYAVEQAMKEHPRYNEMKALGVHFEPMKEVSGEALALERMVEGIPWLRGAERVNPTTMNQMRLRLMDAFMEANPNAGPRELSRYAKHVNAMTGRGTFGSVDASVAGKRVVDMADMFVATRNVRAKGQSAANLMGALQNPSSPASRAILADFTKTAGAVLSLAETARMSGAEVGDDPSEPDFLKVRLGNRTIDLLGENRTMAQFVFRVLQSRTNLLGDPKGTKTVKAAAEDLFRDYAAQATKSGIDLARGRGPDGKPYGPSADWLKAAIDAILPSAVGDAYAAGGKSGPSGALISGGAKVGGLSVGTASKPRR